MKLFGKAKRHEHIRMLQDCLNSMTEWGVCIHVARCCVMCKRGWFRRKGAYRERKRTHWVCRKRVHWVGGKEEGTLGGCEGSGGCPCTPVIIGTMSYMLYQLARGPEGYDQLDQIRRTLVGGVVVKQILKAQVVPKFFSDFLRKAVRSPITMSSLTLATQRDVVGEYIFHASSITC